MIQSMEDKAIDCNRNPKVQFASAKNILILLGRVTLLFTFLYLSFLMLAITFQYIPFASGLFGNQTTYNPISILSNRIFFTCI